MLAPRRWSRAAWIACSALTIYAHGFAVLAIGGQVAALWFLPAERRRELRWIRDGFLIALLAAPAILAPVGQISNGEIGFISKPGLNEMRGLVWSMAGRTVTAVPAIGLGVLVALVAGVRAGRRNLHSIDAFRFALPILWMIVPSLVLMSVSYAHPIWLDRYVLWSVSAVVILAAYGLMRLTREHDHHRCRRCDQRRTRVARHREVVSRASESGLPLGDGAARAARLRAGDAIIFSPDEVRLPSEFYLRTAIDLDELLPVFPSQDWGHFKTGDEHIDHVDQRVIERVIAKRYPRLWVVSYASPGVIVPRVNQLRVAYRVVSDREYQGIVDVTLLVAR